MASDYYTDTGDDSEYDGKRRRKEKEPVETELFHENAWDLLFTVSGPKHELYPIGCESTDTLPVMTKCLQQHGLRGLHPGDVIEVIGNEQSGKTQLLYQWALDCCLPSKLTVTESTENGKPTVLELHGHNARCIHFDLLRSFSIDRIRYIFIKVLFRKIHRHNKRIETSPSIKKYEGGRAPPLHRHSMPLKLNQQSVAIKKQRIRSLKINEYRFEKSSECESLWKLVVSRMEVVAPMTPIHFIVAVHKLRKELNELYSAKIPDHDHYEHDIDFNEMKDCDDVDEMEIDGDDDQDRSKMDDQKIDGEMKEQRECTIQQLIMAGDDGMRLILIDDINAFFNELTATHQRDRYYDSCSSQLMDLCADYGLNVIFTRFSGDKKERQWLKYMLPINDLRAVRNSNNNNQCTLKPEDSFHRKFGNFMLENKAMFILFMYREPMQLVDSTVTHPSISNDLFRPNNNTDTRFGEREAINRWHRTLDATQLDPIMYILEIQQKENRKQFGVEEFKAIRGMVVTANEYMNRARKMKQQYHEDYEHAVVKKQMIRFNVIISDGGGFSYNL